MGAVAPIDVDAELMARIERQVIRPTLDGMASAGTPYRGVLYAGLMIGSDGVPRLLEHNVRFGDPETQALMALLDGDLAELLASAAGGRLDRSAVETVGGRAAVVVVLAAEGYPSAARTGDPIDGLEAAGALPEVQIFHAGTRHEGGRVLSAGGRVVGVVATGEGVRAARESAYRAVQEIRFSGMHYRRDIGAAG
jgi:phosphoribosylamine--glycine ligase